MEKKETEKIKKENAWNLGIQTGRQWKQIGRFGGLQTKKKANKTEMRVGTSKKIK